MRGFRASIDHARRRAGVSSKRACRPVIAGKRRRGRGRSSAATRGSGAWRRALGSRRTEREQRTTMTKNARTVAVWMNGEASAPRRSKERTERSWPLRVLAALAATPDPATGTGSLSARWVKTRRGRPLRSGSADQRPAMRRWRLEPGRGRRAARAGRKMGEARQGSTRGPGEEAAGRSRAREPNARAPAPRVESGAGSDAQKAGLARVSHGETIVMARNTAGPCASRPRRRRAVHAIVQRGRARAGQAGAGGSIPAAVRTVRRTLNRCERKRHA